MELTSLIPLGILCYDSAKKNKLHETSRNFNRDSMKIQQKVGHGNLFLKDFESIEKVSNNKYILKGISTSESTIKISGSALVYKI